jgi:CHAD domain-containing protein
MDSTFSDPLEGEPKQPPSEVIALWLKSRELALPSDPSPGAQSSAQNEAAPRPSGNIVRVLAQPADTQPGPGRTEPWLAPALAGGWKTYRKRLEQCWEEPSEEAVHELRVATRRLISQLLLLGSIVPGRRPQKALRMLKRQLKSLGDLRDTHVQWIFLEQRVARFPELAQLLNGLESSERALIQAASRQINRFKIGKLEKWTRRVLRDLKVLSDDARTQARMETVTLCRAEEAFAATVLRRRLIDSSDLRTIHRTRVAFKKFRYMVEALPPASTGLSKRDLRHLAQYQRRMGRIQDLEVIEAGVRDLVKRDADMASQLTPFFAYLRRYRNRALRAFLKSADQLLEFWPRPAASGTLPEQDSV